VRGARGVEVFGIQKVMQFLFSGYSQPENIYELIGFIVRYGPNAVVTAMIAYVMMQNKWQLKKQDKGLENQDKFQKQLDGVTTERIDTAKILGHAEGHIEGVDIEHQRLATLVETAAEVAQKLAETRAHE
jgi:hypothetical protein